MNAKGKECHIQFQTYFSRFSLVRLICHILSSSELQTILLVIWSIHPIIIQLTSLFFLKVIFWDNECRRLILSRGLLSRCFNLIGKVIIWFTCLAPLSNVNQCSTKKFLLLIPAVISLLLTAKTVQYANVFVPGHLHFRKSQKVIKSYISKTDGWWSKWRAWQQCFICFLHWKIDWKTQRLVFWMKKRPPKPSTIGTTGRGRFLKT